MLSVAPRDGYQYYFYNIEDDGSIYLVVYDDPKDDMPEEPGCVRMSMPLGGISFVPMRDDQSKCMVTFYGEANIGGYIPKYIQTQAIADSAWSLVKLRKLMVDYVRINKKELESTKVIK